MLGRRPRLPGGKLLIMTISITQDSILHDVETSKFRRLRRELELLTLLSTDANWHDLRTSPETLYSSIISVLAKENNKLGIDE